MTSVKLGVHLPVSGRSASPEAIAEVAEQAEQLGLDSVWAWERLMRPTVPIAMGGPGGPVMDAPEDFGTVYDPIETLSYVAARTTRITLGTSVIDGLFSSPVILARRLATLDRFSVGRLVVGIGQGWMEQEFAAAGVPMSRRGAGFEEHLTAMRAVWGPDPVSFEGRYYRIPEADIGPKPVRPDGPTMVVGAAAPEAVQRAARMGLGLTLVIFDWNSTEAIIEMHRVAARESGFDHLPVLLQVNATVTAEPQDERGPLAGSLEQVAEDLDRAERLGVEHVYWNTGSDPTEQLPRIAQLRSR